MNDNYRCLAHTQAHTQAWVTGPSSCPITKYQSWHDNIIWELLFDQLYFASSYQNLQSNKSYLASSIKNYTIVQTIKLISIINFQISHDLSSIEYMYTVPHFWTTNMAMKHVQLNQWKQTAILCSNRNPKIKTNKWHQACILVRLPLLKPPLLPLLKQKQ